MRKFYVNEISKDIDWNILIHLNDNIYKNGTFYFKTISKINIGDKVLNELNIKIGKINGTKNISNYFLYIGTAINVDKINNSVLVEINDIHCFKPKNLYYSPLETSEILNKLKIFFIQLKETWFPYLDSQSYINNLIKNFLKNDLKINENEIFNGEILRIVSKTNECIEFYNFYEIKRILMNHYEIKINKFSFIN